MFRNTSWEYFLKYYLHLNDQFKTFSDDVIPLEIVVSAPFREEAVGRV